MTLASSSAALSSGDLPRAHKAAVSLQSDVGCARGEKRENSNNVGISVLVRLRTGRERGRGLRTSRLCVAVEDDAKQTVL